MGERSGDEAVEEKGDDVDEDGGEDAGVDISRSSPKGLAERDISQSEGPLWPKTALAHWFFHCLPASQDRVFGGMIGEVSVRMPVGLVVRLWNVMKMRIAGGPMGGAVRP